MGSFNYKVQPADSTLEIKMAKKQSNGTVVDLASAIGKCKAEAEFYAKQSEIRDNVRHNVEAVTFFLENDARPPKRSRVSPIWVSEAQKFGLSYSSGELLIRTLSEVGQAARDGRITEEHNCDLLESGKRHLEETLAIASRKLADEGRQYPLTQELLPDHQKYITFGFYRLTDCGTIREKYGKTKQGVPNEYPLSIFVFDSGNLTENERPECFHHDLVGTISQYLKRYLADGTKQIYWDDHGVSLEVMQGIERRARRRFGSVESLREEIKRISREQGKSETIVRNYIIPQDLLGLRINSCDWSKELKNSLGEDYRSK